MTDDVRISTLDNGLRVVTDSMASVESATIGVWVGTGSRAEEPEVNGAAHFLEHMAFKGTTSRSALDIALEVEAVGGSFNAYTARENTAYFMKVLRNDVGLATDILADILQHPTFDEEELRRERGVILQEIGQAHDTPDDIIYDYFQETAYPDQAMGRPILGTSDLVRNMPRDALIGFMKERYQAGNMVLVAAGAVDHDEIVERATRDFADLSNADLNQQEPARYEGGDFRQNRESEQVHLKLGFESASYGADDQFDFAVLSNILGGGMSSRLFQEVREKRGLVYSIFAYASAFQDSGLFGIYAGTGPDEVPELLPIVCDELVKLPDTITGEELERARAQLKASLLMGMESTSNRADQLGNQMLVYGRPWSMEELIEKIDAVTEDSLAGAAKKLIASKPTLTAIGPLAKLESYDSLLARFTCSA
ncbi:M16 family metallopeptidase [Aestuariispira ectoiniformans]|uniref:M16 family metallopeptidase n=1 Tax=Aestuariispira ectoiniformans TaxID=2775080 RepID=UPI00223C2525|nr:pitrilysin family protein [Aestuariispira ectoiniformans]